MGIVSEYSYFENLWSFWSAGHPLITCRRESHGEEIRATQCTQSVRARKGTPLW